MPLYARLITFVTSGFQTSSARRTTRASRRFLQGRDRRRAARGNRRSGRHGAGPPYLVRLPVAPLVHAFRPSGWLPLRTSSRLTKKSFVSVVQAPPGVKGTFTSFAALSIAAPRTIRSAARRIETTHGFPQPLCWFLRLSLHKAFNMSGFGVV